MFKHLKWALLALTVYTGKAQAQMDSYIHSGEFGFSVGTGHYFGDLNTSAALDRPKLAAGIFFRKQISNYIGVRLHANYAQLGYSDVFSKNETQRRRNLSFNSNVYELGVSGDFNFFKFNPGWEGYNFTPYVSLGVSMFTFDPFAYLGGERYFLRELGTEGQGSSLYPDRQPYSTTAFAIPLGVGVKYALNEKMNFFAELSYRFTNTDYLDDVSTTYAPDAFPLLPNGNPSPAQLLSDRSYETGPLIGTKGRQRGNSLQNDAFATLQFGVSFNLSSYKCPR
ncbi:MAG: hypothetical protein EAZ47_09540 [Bacteroidetes bacterium]|nr:MAG: hypothetical protein EAY72_09250 [Bacteroidota bacterium]TAE72815.1 MAG: hypothetical protein EAY68_00290 [Bacteroidota bacterium]TAF91677.1 MAG: hypothetical protein EAZ47_09540 [Bacteroidota bacterium]